MSVTFAENLFDLKEKVAVVTGGAGILGQHFAAGLASHGAKVAIIDHDEGLLEAALQNLHQQGYSDINPFICDLRDPAQIDTVLDNIHNQYGKIDILHNNAASKSENLEDFFQADEDFKLEVWHEIMNVNVDAMFLVARKTASFMKQHRSGSIIQTASIYGILGPDARIYDGSSYLGHQIRTPAIYSTSKAAVVGLTRHLATSLACDGIRVNCLTPGGVSSGQNSIFNQKYSNRVPMGRMAEAHEMVGTLIFLASAASSYITGQNIVIDGGLSAW